MGMQASRGHVQSAGPISFSSLQSEGIMLFMSCHVQWLLMCCHETVRNENLTLVYFYTCGDHFLSRNARIADRQLKFGFINYNSKIAMLL